MPLSPYTSYRQITPTFEVDLDDTTFSDLAFEQAPATPPVAEVPGLIPGSHARNVSSSSNWSQHSSPDQVVVTPRHTSPIYSHGPTLLPKIRTQDESFDAPHQSSVPRPHKRSASYAEYSSVISPTSAVSNISFDFSAGINSSIQTPITPVVRQNYGHGRSISSSSIDQAVLSRYGYPTYRQQPTYVSSNFWTPASVRGTSTFAPPIQAVQPRMLDYTLPDDQFAGALGEDTTTPIEYLRSPNPSVNLVQRVNTAPHHSADQTTFWWDIRNVTEWSDFKFETVMAVPSFPQLLNIDVNVSRFPEPVIRPGRLHPECESSLIELIRDHYMVKVNSALNVALGSPHITMRLSDPKSSSSRQPQPTFVSNYINAGALTLYGNRQGRVVGLALPYTKWNSNMRRDDNNQKIAYLDGLAKLQGAMREHQCRYGFIISELELVCVRYGTSDIPVFGALELSRPIETRLHGDSAGLTVNLALWYLHMLARDEPLPGQLSWRLDVGAPAAVTRQIFNEQVDSWIPVDKVHRKDSRVAKGTRGWVWPSEPYCRKRESKNLISGAGRRGKR
jgi:hypothetical protein